MKDEETKQEIREAINEMSILIQVLQDTSVDNSRARDTLKDVIRKVSKEQDDLIDNLKSYGEDDETKKQM